MSDQVILEGTSSESREKLTSADAPARHRTDRDSAAIWLLTRVAIFIASTYSTWVLAGARGQFVGSGAESIPELGPIAAWHRWDLDWYASIAQSGYGAVGFENNFAFLPGFPALLWAGGKVGLHPTLVGLIVSLLAGLIAAIALGRLARSYGVSPQWTVLVWAVAPMAVYLAAPYTEALFCALAFPAWLLARNGRWFAASVLTAVACVVRMNGLFLACALIVLFLTSSPRPWRKLPWLALPFAALLAVFAYFHALSGSWSVWFDAQAQGWNRRLTNPFITAHDAWDMAFNNYLMPSFAIQYRFEIVFVVILVALTLTMLVMRWWAEAVYVGLTVVSLATSTLYYSVPRAALVLFPVWLLLGLWMTRHRWVGYGYLAISVPLMFIGVIGFVDGRWIA
jgi:hypothetical protein